MKNNKVKFFNVAKKCYYANYRLKLCLLSPQAPVCQKNCEKELFFGQELNLK